MANRAPGRSFAGETAQYFAIHWLVVAGALASMPITTRLLTQQQYGQLNLLFTFTGLVAVVGVLGFANATTRFFPHYRHAGAGSLRRFCETMLSASLCSGIVLAVLASLGATSMTNWLRAESFGGQTVVAALIVVRIVTSVAWEVLRSEGAIGLMGLLRVGTRWATAAVAACWMWFDPRAISVVAAATIVEIVALVWAGSYLHREQLVRWPRMTATLIREANTYGLPLALASGAGMISAYADRFLIEHYLGATPVAQYSVPYDLTRELAKALFLPVQMALAPRIFRLWTEGRSQEVSRSMSDLITHLLAVALPLGAVFTALGPAIVTLMASARYESSAQLIPYFLPGVFLNEAAFLLGIGPRLDRRTGAVALISFGTALLNIALNVVALPVLGLAGAAAVTTVTYIVQSTLLYRIAAPVLQLRLGTALIVKSALVAAAAFVAIRLVGVISPVVLIDILVRGTGGVAFCLFGTLALDSEARRLVMSMAPGGDRAAA